jgi:hypothetical protein
MLLIDTVRAGQAIYRRGCLERFQPREEQPWSMTYAWLRRA